MIEKVQGRPHFSILYKLLQKIYDKLRKVHRPIYPDGGYYGFMMYMQAFFLFNTIPCKYPVNWGTFFKVPATDINDTDQKSEERQWKALNDFRDNFNNVSTAVLTLL